MSLVIAGIGTALPPECLSQADAVQLHATFCRVDDRRARTLRALYRRSGISHRRSALLDRSDGPLEGRQSFYAPATHDEDAGPSTFARMAAYERLAPPLAVSAGGRALDAGGVAAADVTHLVTVSCTGFVSPGVDAAIVEGLGLRREVERTNVGFMGCHGALNGVRVANAFAEAAPDAVPLMVAVELCTLHFAYGWDPDMLVANALFSDGAAAFVGTVDRVGTDVGTHGGLPSEAWRVAATGTHLMADSAEAMTWRVGDNGFRMTLSARVPELIEARLRPWLIGWLSEQGLEVDDVQSWAIHPGGPRILAAAEAALGLSRDSTAASRSVLRECGNMSSATILFILDRMRAERAPRPCVALAFGPGLAVEATLLV